MPKTAIEKMQTRTVPQIETNVPRGFPGGGPGVTMVISTPGEIEALIRRVPKGKVTTINAMREHLARKHNVSMTCPITTGIFTNIVAHAAEEYRAQGVKRLAPYWRVLKSDGSLNEKYPGGVEAQREKLAAEGVLAEPLRTKLAVPDFEKRLAKL
jgi:alkylated DNA nucleotide flippase Atl1